MRSRMLLVGLTVLLGVGVGCGGSGEAKEPWDLVFFSDSGGYGVADRYGALASERLGREVRVHDYSGGDQSVKTVLELVKGDAAADVAAAEIIVVYGNPFGTGTVVVESADMLTRCLQPPERLGPPPVPATEADWQPYVDMLGQVYDEIWRSRGDRPAVVRAIDWYSPTLGELRAAGIAEECVTELEGSSAAMRRAAEANGATMVSTFDLLNGPEHDQDPAAAGYISPDRMHLTDPARDLVAKALDEAGYEPSVHPAS